MLAWMAVIFLSSTGLLVVRERHKHINENMGIQSSYTIIAVFKGIVPLLHFADKPLGATHLLHVQH